MNPVIFANLDYSCVCVTLEYFKVIISGVRPQWWGAVGRKSYPTVRLGAPANLKYLHSKTGRRVDLARVRYGTMQSERRRR